MQRIRAVLRLKHELRRSHREIARALGIANSTVSDYARRALAAGLSCPLPQGLDDAPLEAALFPPLSEGPAAVHAAPSSTTTKYISSLWRLEPHRLGGLLSHHGLPRGRPDHHTRRASCQD